MKFNRHFASWFGGLILGICGLNTSLRADSVVVFNEIMYHPGQTQTSGEWIELHNQMAVDVDISGWSIKDGVTYTFPEGTILPGGGYLLIAQSPAALETETGITGIWGPFNGSLSNAGEKLRLENNSGRLMDAMEYNDKGDWPVAPDGAGVTLAKKHKNKASAAAENWTWSSQIGGTPGTENFPVLDMRPVQHELVSKNDTWRFNSQGSNLGQTWRQAGYSDSTWSVGQAGFYYGSAGGSGEPEKITTLFSSGLDNEGNPLSPGQYDPHYRFVATGQQVIAMQNHPAWLANDAASQWIGFSGRGTDNQAPGQFYIATTFDLTGWNPKTASITLYLSADNRVDNVLINGVGTAITCPSYNQWYGPFVINSGFIDGLNTLQFVFTNEGSDVNPAGLRVRVEGTAVADYGRTQLPACPTTTYFRKTFSYNKPDSATLGLQLEGLIDDGAVLYLNNVEIYRSNMPSGSIAYTDAAISNLASPAWIGPLTLPADALQNGLNTLAVEVHQAVGGLNDLFFLAELNVTETPIPPGEGLSLIFTEIPAFTSQPFWVEIANAGSRQVNLAGAVLSLNGSSSARYIFPSQTLAPTQVLSLDESVLGFRPAEDDRLFLYTPQQAGVMDAAVIKDTAQARLTTTRGPWYVPQETTPGQANDIRLHTDIVINEIMYHKGDTPARPGEYRTTVLVPAGARAFVIIPSDNSFGTTWTGANEPFNDSAWTAGTGNTTGIGYDRDPDYLTDIGTDIYDEIYNVRQSFYARIPFDWTSTTVESMTLNIKYDDGFIAYLNGQKIAERNAPASPTYTSGATASHESYGYETIDVSAYIGSLKSGQNILAIHGLNYGVRSTDLLILPELIIREEVTAPVEADESIEEWIELINKGSQPVDLSGWQMKGDMDFSFAPNTILAAGDYLVVARDHLSLLSQYPSIAVVGDFKGRLPNSGGKVQLTDANGNVADEVVYFDDRPWPAMADGYNASLELRNPNADNSNPQSWYASDESGKSQWKTYTYRGVAQPSSVSEPDSQWREFVIGMLDAGQILLDNISVIEDPDGTKIQLIQNGTFETSPADSKWRLLGSHRHGTVIPDPDNPQNHVLNLISTGPTDHMHNHIETTLASGRSIINGRTYEISFRAKWISGSNQLNTRLYFNRLAKTTLIDKPRLNGTPGTQNSCYQSNPGPVFSNLTHKPAVPQNFEPVNVSVEANDPQGIATVTLYWRLDGRTWNTSAMTVQSNGTYAGIIPAQTAGTVVQFYVQAADQQGAVSTAPAAGPDSRALYRVNDGLAATNGLHNVRIIMTAQDDAWLHTEINVMSNDRIGATVIYDEDEIFYDVGVRLKGSQHHRTPANEVGFNVSFCADQLFRGAHKTVAIDRSQGVGFGQREILINQAMNHSGAVVSKYSDLIKVLPLRPEHTSAAELQLARYNDEYLDSQFEDGSSGYLYEYEFVYYPQSTIGGEEDYKLPLPDGVVWNNPIVSMGAEKENYRWTYLGKNNRAQDSYDRLMQFTGVFGDTSSAYYTNLPNWLDVDQWLNSFAIAVASGADDNYGSNGSGHNAMLYVRPSDGRVLYFPHDLDYYPYSPYQNSIVPNGDLNKMIAYAGYERLYYGHLYHLLNTSYNQTYMSYWANHFGQLLAGQDFGAYLSFIHQRSQYLLSELNSRIAPKYAFEITSADATVDSDYAQVSGKAWMDVRNIYLEGIESPLELQWTSQGTGTSKVFLWTATVPLEPGVNNLVFHAYGFKGELVGSDTITMTSTLQERPLRDFLRITEIMYAPAGGSDYEFIELCNTGPTALDLKHVVFSEGISFAFAGSPVQSLAPGQYVVVAANSAAFCSRYGTSITLAGQFTGKLSNEGETVALVGRWNAPVTSLTYNNGRGWPLAAAGAGHSLVPRQADMTDSQDYGANWRASTYRTGSPGQADPQCPESVLLNEIMAHTDYFNPSLPEYDSNDWIELYNPAALASTLTAGQWYLSDNADNLKKWPIPQTVIAAKGWTTFDEVTGFHYPITAGFGLDKAGEQVYLSYLPGTSEDRVVDCIRFEGQENDISFGRFPDGGTFWQQMPPSRNSANQPPTSHVVISEIMYHPLDGQSEFIELYNPTGQPVSLWDAATNSGWRLEGGIDYTFSQTASIPPQGHLLVVPFAPDAASINQWVGSYGSIPAAFAGPYSGSLSNSGERVSLQKPQQADAAGLPNPWVTVDEVIYFDSLPWPVEADGSGASLWRVNISLSGSDPAGWSSALPSPGTMTCDFTRDGRVDLSDWAILAQAWLMASQAHIADINKTDETMIDMSDAIILLENWLWQSGN